jgi:DNA (cytosine-5)-methyltransferase 3A
MSIDSGTTFISIDGKAPTQRTSRGRSLDKKHNYQIIQLERGFNEGGIYEAKSPTVSASAFEQNNLVIQLNPSAESGGNQPYQQNRIYLAAKGCKIPTHQANMSFGAYAIYDVREMAVRRLTPTECARLQTIPAWYRWECSDTQIYKMLGNGWTIEAVKHILGFMECSNKVKQISNL